MRWRTRGSLGESGVSDDNRNAREWKACQQPIAAAWIPLGILTLPIALPIALLISMPITTPQGHGPML